MDSQVAIKINQVSKAYKLYDNPADRIKEAINIFGKNYHKDFYSLKDVSFEIKKGEIFGIIGENGCGKSTLLKMIAGVLTPTSGTVEVSGRISALLELGAGFNLEFTGIENIYLNGTIMGYSKSEIDGKLQDIIKFADIGDFIYQPLKMYSSGMFARLAFAVNSNVDPDIFIVDEALSVGDMFFQSKCIAKMRKMMEKGTTVLFVSHDTNTLKGFCNKAVWLKKGKLVQYGEANDVISSYEKTLIENINTNNTSDVLENKELLEEAISEIQIDEFDSEKHFRRGTGAAKLKSMQVLDSKGHSLHNSAEFNQEVCIRAYVDILADCENLAVVYRIRNKQGLGIIGNNSVLSGTDIYDKKWKKGQRFSINFRTKLPIAHGTYSMTLLISSFTDKVSFSDVVFLDWIENAYVFEMKVRRPEPIDDFVHIDNQVEYRIL